MFDSKLELTTEQRRAYMRDGMLILPGTVEQSRVEDARRAINFRLSKLLTAELAGGDVGQHNEATQVVAAVSSSGLLVGVQYSIKCCLLAVHLTRPFFPSSAPSHPCSTLLGCTRLSPLCWASTLRMGPDTLQ